MESPRFLGSRFYFWLITPWVVIGIVAFGAVAKGSFADGRNVAGLAASYFAFLCALGIYAMVSEKHGLACGRIVAATVALAYVGYFVGTYFVEGQSLMPTGRKSDSTPFNAILGFIVIGLPCAQFAISGVPFWRISKKGRLNPERSVSTQPKTEQALNKPLLRPSAASGAQRSEDKPAGTAQTNGGG